MPAKSTIPTEIEQTLRILLVEDDDVDAEAVIRAFRKKKIANPIVVVRDGIEALETLRGTETTAPFARPFLILLDLNMPRMDGIEFLKNLREDPALRDSVVFMLTTSDAVKDKLSAYDHQVAGYLVKARVGDDFLNLVNMLDHYWRYVELPPERSQ